MQKITPHLWFSHEAEEASQFYTSIFKNGKIGATARYPEAGKEIHRMTPGSVMTTEFEIEGYKFLALNAGPLFKFTPAISFMVNFTSKDELKEVWDKLASGGEAMMPLDKYPFSEYYGWIKDKFGITWQLIYADNGAPRQIIPAFLFTGDKFGKTEEAINFYTSVFKDGKVLELQKYGADQVPGAEGKVMYSDFTIEGQKFIAMDGPGEHAFTFNEAISLLVSCNDQEEIDYYWNKLSADKNSEQCGWLKDQYGVSWQIAWKDMGKVLGSPERDKANRAMAAMMQMKKIDIAKLEEAFNG